MVEYDIVVEDVVYHEG